MIVGQKEILSELIKSIDDERFAHATLIEGLSGYGTLAIALELAQYLVCKNKGQRGGPCGACNSCSKASKFIHPDIHFAFPVVTIPGKERKSVTSTNFLKEWRAILSQSKYFSIDEWVSTIVKTTARPNINVTECNQIIQQLNLQSFEGGAKVQIIWMANYLGNNGNRLLKLIEEPPENTYIIMINSTDGSVINTIRSRCQAVKLPRISDTDIEQALVSLQGVQESKAKEISFLAEGDWITALGLIDVDNQQLFDIALELLESAQSGDFLRMRSWTEQMEQFDLMSKKSILNYALKLLKEVMHLRYQHTDLIKIAPQELDRLQRSPIVAITDVHKIGALSEMLSETQINLDRNANSRILLYNSCLRIESILNRGVMYMN